ncbi:disulfide bond formation protein B [Porticoccus litoralis]|uniref:Disulfide bond formation protein B n=1 Tax=Porticoccus litoralis TaxID=434086 RepID=A0AAW8B377_9GAMM|nr:disulfide bond formation protein B [Porticoccus litoralis]MDP1520679.1 disulfide bond formation protein B [Porticoccus litoralis]
MPSTRQVFLLMFVACLSLILVALYMQHVMELTPCYLCITQRVFVMLTGGIALLAFLHNSKIRLYGILTALSALGGSFFSGKQLWLQSLPEDQVPACGPPAEYLFDVFSFNQALSMLLRGDGNCAEVQWTFLGLSIPGWTMICFLGLAALGLWQVVRKP